MLTALQHSRSQVRATHKFLIVLTTGLDQILTNDLQSWQLVWEDLIYLVISLEPLLADGGSFARPVPGAFEEEETEDDWNIASQGAEKLVDEACKLMKRWKTPDRFALDATRSQALLVPFTQYIKRLTARFKIPGRPATELAFEEFAKYTENVKTDIKCGEVVYAEFKSAWQRYLELPRSELPPADIRVSVHSQGPSTSASE